MAKYPRSHNFDGAAKMNGNSHPPQPLNQKCAQANNQNSWGVQTIQKRSKDKGWQRVLLVL